LIDPELVVLNDGDSFAINENTQKTVVFNSADSRLTNWDWRLLNGAANIGMCDGIDNFDLNDASNSLNDTCAKNGSCEIIFDQTVIENTTRFTVTTPQMRAPAALEYQFTTTNDDGENITRKQLLCAIPINEAPIAQDDLIKVMRGTVLTVDGDDEKSLLFNDSDDDDIRNWELQINTDVDVEPRFAKTFELFSDGGYIYEPAANAPLSSNGSISDRFTYSVTDGSSTSTAVVSVQVTPFNTPPTQSTDIPDITASIVQGGQDMTFANLNNYFSDAQNDALTFSLLNDSLPESGHMYITEGGEIKGRPLDDDSGRYFVQLQVSDTYESIESSLYLNIVRRNGRNKAPYADDISNTIVSGEFTYDVSSFFGDADGDHLTFSATPLPAGVTISPDGVISGTASNQNRGRKFIRVTANDGNGGKSDDGFRMVIR